MQKRRAAGAAGGRAGSVSAPPPHTTIAVPPCRDRMSTPRGPCSLPVLREAWTQGVVDENTLVWGQVRVCRVGCA